MLSYSGGIHGNSANHKCHWVSALEREEPDFKESERELPERDSNMACPSLSTSFNNLCKPLRLHNRFGR